MRISILALSFLITTALPTPRIQAQDQPEKPRLSSCEKDFLPRLDQRVLEEFEKKWNYLQPPGELAKESSALHTDLKHSYEFFLQLAKNEIFDLNLLEESELKQSQEAFERWERIPELLTHPFYVQILVENLAKEPFVVTSPEALTVFKNEFDHFKPKEKNQLVQNILQQFKKELRQFSTSNTRKLVELKNKTGLSPQDSREYIQILDEAKALFAALTLKRIRQTSTEEFFKHQKPEEILQSPELPTVIAAVLPVEKTDAFLTTVEQAGIQSAMVEILPKTDLHPTSKLLHRGGYPSYFSDRFLLSLAESKPNANSSLAKKYTAAIGDYAVLQSIGITMASYCVYLPLAHVIMRSLYPETERWETEGDVGFYSLLATAVTGAAPFVHWLFRDKGLPYYGNFLTLDDLKKHSPVVALEGKNTFLRDLLEKSQSSNFHLNTYSDEDFFRDLVPIPLTTNNKQNYHHLLEYHAILSYFKSEDKTPQVRRGIDFVEAQIEKGRQHLSRQKDGMKYLNKLNKKIKNLPQ